MVTQPREKNSNWKGGRTVTPDGYILIKVEAGHHLADVRGYAYAHRLAAEEAMARRLAPGERVSFLDGDRSNSAPENLIIRAKRCAEEVRADKIKRATIRKRGVEPVPTAAADSLIDSFEGRCAYCGDAATCFDHISPVVGGGKTEAGNILPACGPCNGSKHSRDVIEWIEATGRTVPIPTLEFLAFHGHMDAWI